MLSVQMEQRVNLKFLFKLEKTFTEAYAMLKEVYGHECLSHTQVFEWFKLSKEGRETTEINPRRSNSNLLQTNPFRLRWKQPVNQYNYCVLGYSEKPIPYETENQKYLINTSKCRIPDIDPFNSEVNKYVCKEEYSNCTNLGLLTYIDKSDGVATLRVNGSLLPLYTLFPVTCCYSKIFRTNYVNNNDNEITFSACQEFKDKTVISYPFIRVTCSSVLGKIYSNTHATVIPNETRILADGERANRFSILLVGIDSISKLNLRRTLPKTYAHLKENYLELRGYNKIGDNTFPNLMAVLTGRNTTQLDASCNAKAKLNNCDIIWDTFRALGYTTAYAEDEANIATFNYERLGFLEPPTDYYYRPYVVASEALGKRPRYGMTFCAGPETSGERVFNVAKDFAVSFKDSPAFGLFWMNSFSHDDINIPSAMDEKVLEFLGDTSFRSAIDDTIVIFFSDHGFRFGDIRYTHTGWLEERLPFIYFHIPDSFKRTFPSQYRNFLINTERLTTPYDIYNTLQDVLQLGNGSYRGKRSLGCPNCYSLFQEIPESRTCKEAAIDQHWCTCTGHNYISPKDRVVRLVAEFVVEHINGLVDSFPEDGACADYALSRVVSAGMSESYLNEKNQTVYYFLVIIETSPSAMFEATVEAYLGLDRNYFQLLGDISRVDRYAANSACVKDAVLKKYCYCDGFLYSIKKFVCPLIRC
ncbi:hypothetical protein NQ318_015719 [Aromia moschata]|uniref:Uncharacterized protein n=1 Tax=Aromia moschata TaxID=1265417 RepID=A0AAV8XXN2_9CUCU|nr:hypothetical protein NQ318_015719 [Aromia moschata]